MPSPIGHSLAGLAVGFAIEPCLRATAGTGGSTDALGQSPRRLSRFVLTGALISVLPDADLLYPAVHRGISHSVGATIFLIILTAAVTGWVTGRIAWRWVALVGLAHGSHIFLDWLGTDRYPPAGVEALWPFSREFYISGWNIFPPTERRIYLPAALAINVRAVVTELSVMGPVAGLMWLAGRRYRSRGRTSAPDIRQPPSV